ncbi:MAG: BamA/TamA family outer membrane protein [Bacteroidales bacterium]|nr:BamA/TamA family outer membrane protein [Bacteroidales bacterium]
MKRSLLLIISLLSLVSCSTTKLVPEGSYRLLSNKVVFEGEKLSPNDVTPYIRQQAKKGLILGWSPGMSIYNWSNGSGQGINRVWETIGTPPVIFDPSQIEGSCVNIAKHLETLGYYGSKVTGEVDFSGRLAKVKYHVMPGKRIPIDQIVYEVPGGSFGEHFRADSSNITVHVGDFLSEKALEAETVRGAGVFRNLGYYEFNKNFYTFEADTLSDVTTLYYRIREEPRVFHIGQVNISHPAGIPFRESLLRKFNVIQPGALYNEQIVNTTYARLAALKVFNSVSVEMSPADSVTVDCDIRLSGLDQLGFKINLEASTNASDLLGFSPKLNLYHKNLFHGGEWLDLGFTGNWQWVPKTQISSSELGVTASLSFPRLLGVSPRRMRGENIPRTEFKASFNYQNRPEYKRILTSFNFGYNGQIGREYFYQLYPLQVSTVKLYEVDETFLDRLLTYPYLWDTFEDQINAGVGAMLYHTTNSDVVPKTAYHYERLSLEASGNVISLFNPILPTYEGIMKQHLLFGLPYKQYVRAELNLGRVFRFGWGDMQSLALHMVAGVGLAYGNSVSLPFEKQFYCGGANGMRGWQARTLGPGFAPLSDYFKIPSQTGDLKFEADIEYRFPSFWKLEWAVFAEAGNVWTLPLLRKDLVDGLGGDVDESERFSLRSIAADWGIGLRVNLDFILIRLDVGFRLHDPARAEGDRWVRPRDWFHGSSAIHFGVGYPF